MVRTGAAERLGGKLFRVCARSEALLQIAILGLSTLFSMFMNDTTVVLVFMPLSLTTSAGFSALMLVMSRSNGWKLMLSNLGRVSPMTTNSNSSARLGSDANAKSNPASQFAFTTSP
jgi:di/tricarboxylate transporter